ncbi:MAG: 4-hydroxy-tetrahydrodipicolinate synthase [Candidatus Dadabacteria bacterium RIFCSPHIGHO2_12_FULL_53_21]|nr:MAG: 4-hydroxy-tetrahydrodipicolinate synthase [Candidatus Dadabacteria bacterium RIFCSPHIGHO2_12_FULL_53_21]
MIHGSLVAIVTPFKNGKIDEDAFKKLIEFQIENGTHGIVPCGTTGESPTLSHEEHEYVIELTVKAVKKRVPVVAGTGSNSTKEAIRLTRFAEQIGADAALLVVPYYNKPTQEGLYLHFKQIASQVRIPLILYNIPGRSGVNLNPETILRLAKDCKNIIGVKEASGSLTQASKILYLCGRDFLLYSGEDALNFPLLAIGARGFITVTANVVPRDVADLYELYIKGEIDKARDLHYRLLPLNDALFIETNPIPVKAALSMMDKIAYEYRYPLCQMSENNYLELKKALTDYGIIN